MSSSRPLVGVSATETERGPKKGGGGRHAGSVSCVLPCCPRIRPLLSSDSSEFVQARKRRKTESLCFGPKVRRSKAMAGGWRPTSMEFLGMALQIVLISYSLPSVIPIRFFAVAACLHQTFVHGWRVEWVVRSPGRGDSWARCTSAFAAPTSNALSSLGCIFGTSCFLHSSAKPYNAFLVYCCRKRHQGKGQPSWAAAEGSRGRLTLFILFWQI